MEILGIIVGIVVVVFVRVLIIMVVQWIFIAIGTIIGGIFSLITGSASKPRRQTERAPLPDYRAPARPSPRRQTEAPARTVEIDEHGVRSDWPKAEKRTHLIKLYNRYNSMMQTAKEEALRSRYRDRMQEVTQAIMALVRLPD